MTWREQLQEASFRGVAFEVEIAELESGRRKAILDAPGRDRPFVQDLGLARELVKIEGFLIGDDYREQRDALLSACKLPGIGDLVHPHHGRLVASCLDVKSMESNRALGMVRISMTFIIEPVELGLVATSDPTGRLADAADSVAAAIPEAAQDLLEGATSAQIADTATTAKEVADVLQNAVEAARGGFSLRDAANLLKRAFSIADEGLAVGSARQIPGVVGEIVRALESGTLSRLAAYGILYSSLETLVGRLKGDRSAEDTLRALTALEVGRAATSAAAGAEWGSFDEALDARNELRGQLGTLADAVPDSVLGELAQLRAALTAAIPPPNTQLPSFDRVVTHGRTNALTLAHEVYGDASRADEIAAENRLRHPAFIADGSSLRVLVDA